MFVFCFSVSTAYLDGRQEQHSEQPADDGHRASLPLQGRSGRPPQERGQPAAGHSLRRAEGDLGGAVHRSLLRKNVSRQRGPRHVLGRHEGLPAVGCCWLLLLLVVVVVVVVVVFVVVLVVVVVVVGCCCCCWLLLLLVIVAVGCCCCWLLSLLLVAVVAVDCCCYCWLFLSLLLFAVANVR